MKYQFFRKLRPQSQPISHKVFVKSMLKTVFFTIGCAYFLHAASCAPVHFSGSGSADNNSPGVTPTGCTNHPGSITKLTKFIFLVDTSGSNAQSTYNQGNCGSTLCLMPPTDPTKSFRDGAIQTFLNTYQNKTNFNWGFITFSADSAHALINNGNDQSPSLASSPMQLQNALNNFMTMSDVGDTPYRSALSMAALAIATDPDRNTSAQPNYYVVMLTDGYPTDYYVNGTAQVNSQQLMTDVTSLISIAPGRINLSTVYYASDNDPTATSLLQTMASIGSGQFVNASQMSQFTIDDVIATNSCN
jgi:von Willebrand factor type A domain